jgi:competence protein ComEC
VAIRAWGLVIIVIAWVTGLALAFQYQCISSFHVVCFVVGGLLACTAICLTIVSFRYSIGWISLIIWVLALFLLGAGRAGMLVSEVAHHELSRLVEGQTVSIRGDVFVEPEPRQHGAMFRVNVTEWRPKPTSTWQSIHGTVLVFTSSSIRATPSYGDTIEGTGSRLAFADRGAIGTDAVLSIRTLRICERGGGNPILAMLFHLREQLAAGIMQVLPGPEAALLIGVILGLKIPELRERLPLFITTGTIHLVVASGTVVTLFASIIERFCWFLPRFIGWILTMGGIVSYVILCGMGPAAWRSGIMGMILVSAHFLGRDYDIFNSLALAVLIMTGISPDILADKGFQLSVAGILGIVILAPRLTYPLEHLLRRVPGGKLIGNVLGTTAAAQIATLPIVASSFGIFSIVSLLANLLLVPLIDIMFVPGLLLIVVATLHPFIGQICGLLLWPAWHSANLIIEWSANLPGAAFTTGTFPTWITPLWLIVLGSLPLWWLVTPGPDKAEHNKISLFVRAGAMVGFSSILAFTTIGLAYVQPAPPLTVAFLDAGTKGPSTLIRTGSGITVLIDGGDNAPSLINALAHMLSPLQRSIDLLIVTGGRQSQIGALLDLPQRYHIGAALLTRITHPNQSFATLYNHLTSAKIPISWLVAGQHVPLSSESELQILSSPADEGAILQLSAFGTNIILSGEASEVSSVLATTRASSAIAMQICMPKGDLLSTSLPTAHLLYATHPMQIVIASSGQEPIEDADAYPVIPGILSHGLRIDQEGTMIMIHDGTQWTFHF